MTVYRKCRLLIVAAAVVAAVVAYFVSSGVESRLAHRRVEALMEPALQDMREDVLAGMYDLVIPVPIYSTKKKKRGFNHADLMAKSFAKRAGLPIPPSRVLPKRPPCAIPLPRRPKGRPVSTSIRATRLRLRRGASARSITADPAFEKICAKSALSRRAFLRLRGWNSSRRRGTGLFERTDELVEISQKGFPVAAENRLEVGRAVVGGPDGKGRFRRGPGTCWPLCGA